MKTQTASPAIKTRQQYMDSECTHREYYAQFVTPYIKARVEQGIGYKRIQKSSDANLNDIPLAQWDKLSQGMEPFLRASLRGANDGYSMAGAVCIFKEAARQLVQAL